MVPSSSVACQMLLVVRPSACTLRPRSTRTPAAMASAMSAVSSALRVSEAAGKGKGASAARLAAARRTIVDRYGAKRGHVDTERVQILKGLTAQELSADLMPRCGLAFDQRDAPSLARERDRSGTACHSTTEDENFVLQRNLIQIGCSNLNLLFRIRYVSICTASSWVLHADAAIRDRMASS